MIGFLQSGVRVRAGSTTTRAGDQVEDWSDGAVDRLSVPDINVQPFTTEELVADTRDLLTTDRRLYSAPGTNPDLTGRDRFEFGGDTYTVIGEPAQWADPLRGGVHHLEALLRKWSG